MRSLLDCFDDLVAVARLFREQGENEQLQISGSELSSAAKPSHAEILSIPETPEEHSETASAASPAMAAALEPITLVVMSHPAVLLHEWMNHMTYLMIYLSNVKPSVTRWNSTPWKREDHALGRLTQLRLC